MTKLFIFFLFGSFLVGCATTLHPHQVPSDKRLVFGRLSHYNGKENFSHATNLNFQTQNSQGQFHRVDDSNEFNNPGYFWALIGREENHLSLREINFSINGSPMSMGKYLDHPLAEVSFRPGPTPLYIGDVVLITEQKKHEAKVLEYRDHQNEAEIFLRKNYDYDHPLTKAILKGQL